MQDYSVVIDANIAVYSVVNTPYSSSAVRLLEKLAEKGAILFAPGLWLYEVTSVIHQYRFSELITDGKAYEALDILTSKMGIELVDVPARAAFNWASRLHQKAAYDGFYLAAAEHLMADMWTADKVLVNNARQDGIHWIHWIGEEMR